ncbi:chorismate-binding protein [Candidatus Woesearchaeota archaeon]|nr:chorismate-binding protein [Candidatus Woesearchaeota archaeon]
MLEKIKNAKIGSILPVYEAIENIDAEEFFIKLSNYGRDRNSVLIQTEEKSICSVNPCLKITGKNEEFEIKALSNTGRKFLQFLKGDFKFCDKVEYGKNAIKGRLKPSRRNVSEDQRLRLKNHADILRAVAFKFKPAMAPFRHYGGLCGMLSYDFIDQFEDLPKNMQDLNEPDYEMYFLDSLFVVNHKENKAYIIANALITDEKKEKCYNECLKAIESCKKAISKKNPKIRKYKKKPFQVTADTPKEELVQIANKIKNHIFEGDISQASISKMIIANYNAEPFDIFRQLKQILKADMFYANSETGILLGSLNSNLRVSGNEEKAFEATIIGAEKPSSINRDLDNKYEVELKINSREIAKHTMLIDLARNDMAKVAKAGSRHAGLLYHTEKRPNRQYLFSVVKGILKQDLDALHAYSAIMSQAGIPKMAAARILRQYEKTKRGFHNGAVCFLSPDGDFDSAVAANTIRLKGNKAYLMGEANVSSDSKPESAFQETEDSARKCVDAIKLAGGLK